MSAREKPEKKKTAKSKADSNSERMRPESDRLERRLRAAKPEKSPAQSQSVSLKELTAIAASAKSKFTLAAIEIAEYQHVEKTRNFEQAEKLANAIEKEINVQLRQDDLVAYTGKGKFFLYLPETAKIESTMVLERLARHISKRNQRRPVAQQISISFKIVDAQLAKDAALLSTSKENDRLANWLQRYQFKTSLNDANWREIKAKDSWKDSSNVLIKRFQFCADSPDKRQRTTQTLSLIQTNGLALFPELIDFFSGESLLCLALEPFSEYKKTDIGSVQCGHNLLISICDLYVQLDALDFQPPTFKSGNFLTAKHEFASVLDGLDKYLIAAMQTDGKWVNLEESVESILLLIGELAKIHGTDECFSTAREQLEKVSARKALIAAVQKIRALLKRHEERLRRTQSAGSRVSG